MTESVAILAAGQFPRKEYPLYLLRSADHLVCCDGALTQALKHNLKVDAVVGDLDSVSHGALERFTGKRVRVSEQESNDLTKAFRFVLETWPDVSHIVILGATGRDEAHTIGNLSLLMQYEREFGLSARGVKVEMVSDWTTAFAVGDSCSLQVGRGRKVSLFSDDRTLAVRSEGLQYPTDAVVFDSWWKATLNRASEDEISLQLNHPSPLLVILD